MLNEHETHAMLNVIFFFLKDYFLSKLAKEYIALSEHNFRREQLWQQC